MRAEKKDEKPKVLFVCPFFFLSQKEMRMAASRLCLTSSKEIKEKRKNGKEEKEDRKRECEMREGRSLFSIRGRRRERIQRIDEQRSVTV